jgi:hypothetical protein
MKSDVEDEYSEMNPDLDCSYYPLQTMIYALDYLIKQPNILDTIIF